MVSRELIYSDENHTVITYLIILPQIDYYISKY